ncbi:aquaporin [Isoptericola sp. b441]|uniref:Aquaporin n=1 Tax=Actinotalea lenta TaxID=3064654 RepID=A0ABT9D4K7_9CELL|nr:MULTISPECIES: aquaporin [unclassified Isoptericola]MDO8105615.1 aquaporin [Isoptericola sp. b441]MDO8122735.1 aquaporin [Isoptericola sp. b490]
MPTDPPPPRGSEPVAPDSPSPAPRWTAEPAPAWTTPAGEPARPAYDPLATPPTDQGPYPPDDDAEPPTEYGLLTRLGAEAFGTFALVLVVVGTLLYGTTFFNTPSELGALGTSLAAGLALIGLYGAFVHVSGAHLNPAVSVASAIAGRITAVDAAFYVVAQLIGGALAATVLYATIPVQLATMAGADGPAGFLAKTANGWGEASALSVLSSGQVEFGLVAALLVETLGSAILVGVVLAGRPSARSATAVGATYGALILLAAPITGGGFNPARSTAVALLSIGSGAPAIGQLWLFWVAPLVGGMLAGLAKLAFGLRERAPLGTVPDLDEDAEAREV